MCRIERTRTWFVGCVVHAACQKARGREKGLNGANTRQALIKDEQQKWTHGSSAILLIPVVPWSLSDRALPISCDLNMA